MKKILLLLCLVFQLTAAEGPPKASLQPIHEALVIKNTDPIPQEVISKKPPPPQAEMQPPQPAQRMIWISGYWEWMREKQDFIWVCGLWRLPPPEHTWSPGYWKDVKDGWTYVKGAWMPTATESWIYSQDPPPAPQNEDTGSLSEPNSFWVPGYWIFEEPQGGWFAKFFRKGEFKWYGGSWQKYNQDWIIEPAHWIWRPEGYLFVPTYWDWTLDVRGVVYDCKSQNIIEPQNIIQQLTFSYPDHSSCINYYWYYQPQIWEGCECIPIWWRWPDWWSLPWNNQWWLWWWWLNPGYPVPPFIPVDIIDIIPPPPVIIIDIFDGFPTPIFITPLGIPSINQWIDGIIDLFGRNGIPFFPPDGDSLIDAIDKLLPQNPSTKTPGGKEGKKDGKPPKKPGTEKTTPASGKGKVPSTPKDSKPDWPKPKKETPPHPEPKTQPPTAPIPSQPTDIPPPVNPSTPPVYTPPTYTPPVYIPPVYEPPSGGYYGGSFGGYYGGGYGSYGHGHGGYGHGGYGHGGYGHGHGGHGGQGHGGHGGQGHGGHGGQGHGGHGGKGHGGHGGKGHGGHGGKGHGGHKH